MLEEHATIFALSTITQGSQYSTLYSPLSFFKQKNSKQKNKSPYSPLLSQFQNGIFHLDCRLSEASR